MNDDAKPEIAGRLKPAAGNYIELARRMNRIAASLLRPDSTGTVNSYDASISFGLSLQAAEVAGKGILRALGDCPECIRKRHGSHDILALLQQTEKELQGRPEGALTQYHHFLNRAIVVGGQKYDTTIGGCLKKLFEKGETAKPRNYLYADLLEFAGLAPTQALAAMADDLITVAQKVSEALEESR